MLRGILATCLLALTFVGCSPVSTPVEQSARLISADELKQLTDSGEDFVLVDVRETSEIEQHGTLPGYIHIPLGEIERRISEVPKGKPIVVACERGRRAAKAAAALQAAGYDDLKTFGFIEYRAKNYPLHYPTPAK